MQQPASILWEQGSAQPFGPGPGVTADESLPAQEPVPAARSRNGLRRPAQLPLKRVKRVLVPTDFSLASAKALELAVALAEQCDAALTILHVVDLNAQAQAGAAAETMRKAWDRGSAQMGELAWSLCDQVEAQTKLEEGLPWEKIVELSRESDLVILGRGRSKKGWKLFSRQTAQRVLANAACPVMVVSDRP